MEIIPFYVILGMFVGMFIMYVFFSNTTNIVLKEPTLENCGKITYLDDSGVCYKYKKKKIEKTNT